MHIKKHYFIHFCCLFLKSLKTFSVSLIIYDSSEDKNVKGTKKCAIKRKLKFEDYKNCLEAIQLENEINLLEKKIDVDSLKEDHKEFIKSNNIKNSIDLKLENVMYLLKKSTRLY